MVLVVAVVIALVGGLLVAHAALRIMARDVIKAILEDLAAEKRFRQQLALADLLRLLEGETVRSPSLLMGLSSKQGLYWYFLGSGLRRQLVPVTAYAAVDLHRRRTGRAGLAGRWPAEPELPEPVTKD